MNHMNFSRCIVDRRYVNLTYERHIGINTKLNKLHNCCLVWTLIKAKHMTILTNFIAQIINLSQRHWVVH